MKRFKGPGMIGSQRIYLMVFIMGEEGPLYIITKGVVGEPRVLPYTNSFPVAYYPTHALMKQSRS